MPGRRLGPEEQALWARVAATVTPLAGRARPARPPSTLPGAGLGPARPLPAWPAPETGPGLRRGGEKEKAAKTPVATDTLDGGWDRRLRRGAVLPDRSIDLHGHTLASAHATLDAALERALAEGTRVLLVVTGKPPRPGRHGRGLIAASIGDWLAHSRHRPQIAAVRAAHPRHGGAGALYLILRRRRGG